MSGAVFEPLKCSVAYSGVFYVLRLENELGEIVCELVLLIFPVYLISCESIRPSGDCSFSLGCVVFDPSTL
jgi:hypothetical protein